MALAAWTLASLKISVIDYIGDDTAEFATWVEDVGIGLAELRLLKDLDLEIFDDTETSIAMTAGNQLISKPAGTITLREIGYTPVGGGAYTRLDEKSPSYLRAYWPTAATQAAPKFVAEENTTQWRVVPTPNAAYPLIIRRMKRPDGLKAVPAGTYLGTNFPDALLYAVLCEAEYYLMEEERGKSVWEDKYMMVLPPHVRERRRSKRRDYQPVRPAPNPLRAEEE